MKLPRPQFSLRTLLIATAIVSIFMAWAGREAHLRYDSWQAVQELRDAGVLVHVRNPPTGPLAKILGEWWTHLPSATARSHELDDVAMRPLARLRSLDGLVLESPAITDATLEHVRHSESLRSLFVARSSVTADGIAKFLPLPNLDMVEFSESQLTLPVVDRLLQGDSIYSLIFRARVVSAQHIATLFARLTPQHLIIYADDIEQEAFREIGAMSDLLTLHVVLTCAEVANLAAFSPTPRMSYLAINAKKSCKFDAQEIAELRNRLPSTCQLKVCRQDILPGATAEEIAARLSAAIPAALP